MVELAIQKRTKESSKKLAAEGKMPAVFYGRKEASTPVAVSKKDFEKVWKEAGESSIIVLKGVDDEKEAIIHDIDFDPVTNVPRHVDFYVVEKGRKLQVTVPIEFTGVSAAVKDLGGTLMKVMHELEVEALPKDLPHEIVVDIGKLATFADRITISDIAFPAGVVPMANGEEVVALVDEAKEEEETPVATEIDMTQIEVEKKGKEETPEEGTEAAAK